MHLGILDWTLLQHKILRQILKLIVEYLRNFHIGNTGLLLPLGRGHREREQSLNEYTSTFLS